VFVHSAQIKVLVPLRIAHFFIWLASIKDKVHRQKKT
jgi:hypothetical protein